jgi:D-alanyl-D-alanine carboxypeptidase/D-alanyl-D-alanine-endopeptidase (penicillin-binding protein 4)
MFGILAFGAATLVGAGGELVDRAVGQSEAEETSEQASDKEAEAKPFARKARPGTAPDEAVAALQKKIDGVLASRISSKAKVGIVAVDTKTGQLLYERNGDEPFNPASNMKLITSATALDHFGPSHTFETTLLATSPEDGTVDGPLYVRGEGEAFLLFEDFIDWAAELKLEGIDTIKGDIVIDDTVFKGEYLPPGFGQKDEDASYRSPIGAVSVNFNAVTAIVEPNGTDKPSIRLFPPNGHVRVVNRARTVGGSGQSLSFSSEPTEEGATELVIGGAIGSSSDPVRSRLRIDNPPLYAGSVLAKALEMVGITVEGKVRTGKVPETADVVVSHESQPLSYIALAMNKWSNNFMAEQLLRTLGREDKEAPSTWKVARRRVVSFLKRVGIETGSVSIKNGSGLYDGNLVSPRQFVRLLTFMLDHPAGPEFVSSLAVAGRDGTLKERMEGEATAGNVRGKTGTLNQVSALSGYVTTASGREVAFSILLNDTPRRGWRYRPAQDAIVEVLAGFEQ